MGGARGGALSSFSGLLQAVLNAFLNPWRGEAAEASAGPPRLRTITGCAGHCGADAWRWERADRGARESRRGTPEGCRGADHRDATSSMATATCRRGGGPGLQRADDPCRQHPATA